MPVTNYNMIDYDYDLLIAAAIWILDKLRASGKLRDALERSREMMDREHDFFLYFDDFLQMDRKKVRRILKNREAAEALTGFTVTDPYELCFALLYLIDTDDDAARLEKPDKVYAYPYETKKRTVVFGGHETFLKAIKPMLPSVKFVNTAILSFDPNIIRNADVVWIQNNCISHSQFGSIVKQCKRAGVQMRYFSYTSAEKCAEQLVTEDLK